jgi:predicted DNA-binding protein (UPF0278 family)
VGCRRTLPSMQRLLDYIERGLSELELACGIRPVVRRELREQPVSLQL